MKKFFWHSVLLVAIVLAGVKSFPQNPTQTFLAMLDSATKAYEQKNWRKAAILWERLATANPVNGHFWEYLASAYYHDKEYDKAIPAFKKLVELGYGAPTNRAYDIACC